MKKMLYKYDILLGDYVNYRTANCTSGYGYVVNMLLNKSAMTYTILDLSNKEVTYEIIIPKMTEYDEYIEVHYTESDYLKRISRNITYNYPFVCNNLCKHLKEFPEACSKYCPIKAVNGKTYYPTLKTDKSSIKSIGFCDFSNCYSFFDHFTYLAKSLPKPDIRFRDLSMEGVIDILNNGDKYKLQDYIEYRTYSSIYKIYNFELKNKIDMSLPSNLGENHPCEICIYKNSDYCKDCGLCTLI